MKLVKEKKQNKDSQTERLKSILANQSLTLQEKLDQIESEQRTEYLHILRWLKEQNWVAEDSNGLWHWNHQKK